MRNEVSVDGAAAALPIEAVETVNARFTNTLYGYFIGDRLAFPLVENYGMESVLENGPWLVRRVPLILNEWTPNTILKKDEIKRVPVWVKMHHVSIVAYSEIGLSLISTQIGKPIMLDSYTSNMCLHSWGRSVYARALIEIAADVELVKSLVIAIPLGNKEGHTFATIDIEYEWTPPRCASCRIFDHVSDKCPKLPKVVPTDKAVDDGFTEVKKKKAKAKQSSKKQVEGIRLNKPPLNLQYRRVDRGESSKQKVNTDVNKVSTNYGPSKTLDKTSKVATMNSFSALSGEDANVWDDDNRVTTEIELHVVNDSDSEDVDEYITMEEGTNSVPKEVSKDQGASTPLEDVSS
ncbi:retrovirus-related pol polyprotein from transposon 17.6 [Tanacetum coccineum]